jgi:hypothetical protein
MSIYFPPNADKLRYSMTQSIKQPEAINEHGLKYLSSKALPSYRQQNIGYICIQKYKKFTYFTILFYVVPPSYLSGQSSKLLAVIYGGIGCMHRYGELNKNINYYMNT